MHLTWSGFPLQGIMTFGAGRLQIQIQVQNANTNTVAKKYAQHCKTKIVSVSLCYSAIWCRYVDVWGGGVKEIQNTNTDIARSGGGK